MKQAVGIFAVMLVIGIALGGRGVLPSTKPLGKLVTSQEARDLHQFYADLATIVRDDSQLATTAQFRQCQALAVDCLQSNGDLGSLSQLNEPINKILTDAFGGTVPDAALTPDLRGKLADALDEVSNKF